MRTGLNIALAPPSVSEACHASGSPGEVLDHRPLGSRRLRVALVGNPNVGKSALFHRLTGRYVTVSNYPGTSVEIARGLSWIEGRGASGGRASGVARVIRVGEAGALGRPSGIASEPIEVLDTPGLYSLSSGTEEQRLVRRLLWDGEVDVVVHVVEAKNLGRMLALTLELLELGRPLVVAVNLMDEAERLGLRLDAAQLARRLGVPVVPVVAIEGRGIEELRRAIAEVARGRVSAPPRYGGGGSALRGAVARGPGASPAEGAAPGCHLAIARQRAAGALAAEALQGAPARDGGLGYRWGRRLARPAWGIPVLLLVVYLGLYQFVGRFGGGTLVDWLEGSVFERHLTPWFTRWFEAVPWEPVRSLFVGEYGLLTLGVRYAVAIILPVVGTFFLFFSVLEDSGYFPRLALLVDRLFKRVGLSGRAVIPMVLGFACDTMATMVTRTLETKRERVLATLLLALAIPCSAQLGVILALLAHQPLALAVWLASLAMIFVVVGYLAARLVPGTGPLFHLELPPLRRPRLGNVLTKTLVRMQWYFVEVLPLFLLASVLLWAGQMTGAFQLVVRGLSPVVGWLGLPDETARVFLFGFFRRDYGAAGLFDLQHRGLLSPAQLVVAAVTLTLFVPCIAQFLMMVKERGAKTAFGMLVLITPIALGAGWALNRLLALLA